MESPSLEQVWRDQWGRVLSLLVAQYRRLDLAEDGLADAFEAAARRWPTDGTPGNPPAWLLTTARRRILDRLRAEAVAARKQPLLVVDAATQEVAQEAARRSPSDAGSPGGPMVDERLRLVFLCAHPALAPESACALSLRLVLGVSTADIARLFLVPTATMAARLTRAKRKLAGSAAPYSVLAGPARVARLETATSVAYLGFTAGYAPGSGADLTRTELAGEAIRMAEVLRELMPGTPVIDALLALMLLQHSRRDARSDDSGLPVLLPDQDRTRWRHDESTRALELLRPLIGQPIEGRAGEYLLQALIAAEHAIAPRAGDTRWDRIVEHYTTLEALTGSPVVRLNRAVALAELAGPAEGLALLDGLDDRQHSHRLPAVRAELLAQLGDREAAEVCFEEAIRRCGNDAERGHLLARVQSVRASGGGTVVEPVEASRVRRRLGT